MTKNQEQVQKKKSLKPKIKIKTRMTSRAIESIRLNPFTPLEGVRKLMIEKGWNKEQKLEFLKQRRKMHLQCAREINDEMEIVKTEL